jgi:hypothetical protein
MSEGPKGELARYAFGYSNKKPGKAWWIIHAVIIVGAAISFVQVLP